MHAFTYGDSCAELPVLAGEEACLAGHTLRLAVEAKAELTMPNPDQAHVVNPDLSKNRALREGRC